jgi:2-polyprenyl-6-methoxyphenol hydroxylase-like FAD-dependent oxidoreductase
MAGLLAARVLADHYREVVLLERDCLPTAPDQRRGVPQGRHAHGVLAAGRRGLETLFPGFSDGLIAQGALPGDVVRDSRWFLEGGCLSRCDSGLDALLSSRPFLEFAVREGVLRLPNVKLLQDRAVNELVTTPDRRRVTGIKTDSELLAADLVVDTAGRGSRSPQWLEAMGYEKPVEERIEIGLGYTTRWFRRRPEHLSGDVAAVIPPTPSGKRGGVMLAQENDRWIVTLITHFQNCAPGDLEGFIAFTKTLPAPYIYQVVRTAEPVGEATTARFPASVWRRYDKLKHFPEGYLVFGDAISSFNPRYGQGMSVAALEALELQQVLATDFQSPARKFFARAAKVIATPWTVAANNDLRMAEARGRRTLASRLINWYMARLFRAAHRDPVLALAFHRVANLIAPPPSVMRPGMAWRVLKGNLPRMGYSSRRGFATFDHRAGS